MHQIFLKHDLTSGPSGKTRVMNAMVDSTITRVAIIVGLAITISIAVASFAQASIWKEGGAEIPRGTNPRVIIRKEAGNANYVVKTAAGLEITCTESTSVAGAMISGGNPGGVASQIELKRCSVTPVECEVQKVNGNVGEIGTLRVTGSLYEYEKGINRFGPIAYIQPQSSEFELIRAAGQNNACRFTAENPYKLEGEELVEIRPEEREEPRLTFVFQSTITRFRLRPGRCFLGTAMTLIFGRGTKSEGATLTGESTVKQEPVANNFGAFLR